jgi:hypothetical protein
MKWLTTFQIVDKVRLNRKSEIYNASHIGSGCDRVVKGAGRKAKRMVLQCINDVGTNPVEGRTKIWQL